MQNQDGDLEARGRARHTIALLYRIEKLLFSMYVGYVGLLLLTLLSGVVMMPTAWGRFVLGGGIPWMWLLPLSLCAAFVFPLADSFIQGREEQWFTRYGTTVLASMTGFDAVKGFNWRFFARNVTEYRAHLTWRQPDTQQVYHYSLRVRDQKLPPEGSAVPVAIDYDDPSYYLKKDIKDPSLLF